CSILLIAAISQSSFAQVKPRNTDSAQDKAQKTPTPKAMPAPPGLAPVPSLTPSTTLPTTPSGNNVGLQKNVVNGTTLTKEQFRALPPNAVIQLPGKQVTKQELLNNVKAPVPGAGRQATFSRLNELRSKLIEKQRADLKLRNDKVMAALA